MSLPHKANHVGRTNVYGDERTEQFRYFDDVIVAAHSRAKNDATSRYWQRLACRDFLGYSLPPQDYATIELIAANKARRDAYLRAQASAAERQRKKRKADARQHGKERRPYKKRRR